MKGNHPGRFGTEHKTFGYASLWWRAIIVLLICASSFSRASAQDSNPPPAATLQTQATNAEETLRSYLQLQEQVHAAQLAIERARQESDAAAAHNAEVMEARLQAIERSLNAQREQELDAVRSSNRTMLIVAGLFVAIGVVAMFLAALFQWRTVHQLAEITTTLSAARKLGALPSVAALGPVESHLVTAGAAEEASGRLLGAMNRLEQRILELEHVAQAPSSGGGSAKTIPEGTPPPHANGQRDAAEAHRITLLLGKGQSLLSLDQPQEALACFDEILQIDAHHTEALVRKGTALERLRKLDEALECYDQAIAADGSLTIAYLYKGGLYNRQERFSDALRCYEQALHTKEQNHG